MNEVVFQQLSKIYEQVQQTTMNMQKLWLTHSVFTWRWWLTVTLTILPWVIWFIVRKKESSARLLFAGVVAMAISSLLENIGISRGYWWVQFKLLPVPTTNTMWSYSLVPVTIMLVLQYKTHLNPLLKAIVYSAIASFGGLFIFQLLGMYHPKHWSNFYSFIIMIIIYLVCNYVVTRSSFDKFSKT